MVSFSIFILFSLAYFSAFILSKETDSPIICFVRSIEEIEINISK